MAARARRARDVLTHAGHPAQVFLRIIYEVRVHWDAIGVSRFHHGALRRSRAAGQIGEDLQMTRLIVGLAAALASGASGVADANEVLNQQSDWKLNLLLAAVVAALIGMASTMPGDW